MNFCVNEEQEEPARSSRLLNAKVRTSPPSASKMDTEAGYDAAVCPRWASRWASRLVIPRRRLGYGFVELIVAEEMGRRLLCALLFHRRAPLVNTPDPLRRRRWVAPTCRGSHRRDVATPRYTEENGRWDESAHHRHGHRRRRHLEDQREALRPRRPHRGSLIIIVAARTDAWSLFCGGRRRPGVTCTALYDHGPDPQAGQGRVRDAPGTPYRHRGRGWARRSTGPRPAAVALAAEQVGGAQKVPEMAVQYAKGPGAVRSPDRLVPGHQAQVRRHAARGRVGQVRRLLRPAWCAWR